MPAVAVNQFAEKSLPVTIEGGQFEEVTFSVRSVNGHAVGNITPVYKDLKSASTTRRRASSSGWSTASSRSWRRSSSSATTIPAKAGQPPRVGAIDHTFAGESIVQFLWFAVRDGIEKSILK